MGVTDLLTRARAPAPPAGLEARASLCAEILHANNTALGGITRIQEALAADTPLSAGECRRLVTGVTVQTYRMVAGLVRLTGRRHRALVGRFEEVKGRIVAHAEVTPALQPVPCVVPLAVAGAGIAESVGQKSAMLGEARRLLGASVPDGFAISATAYQQFMAHDGLGRRIAAVLAAADPSDPARCFSVAARVATMIDAASLPPELEAALTAAALAVPGPPGLCLAVRSSALQEDGRELSFAGQYRSFLNVPRERVAEAYKRVVASKYSPEAITYRAARGIDDGEIAMCCCVLAMVDATSAGVLFTPCHSPTGPRTLLHAVRGLGISAVDGSAAPDTYVLDPQTRTLLSRSVGLQQSQVVSLPGEGTRRVAVAADAGPGLTDEQAMAVARLGWRLAAALGSPVDVEWALGRDGRAAVVQVRPLTSAPPAPTTPGARRVPGATVLLEGGCTASRGVGCGPAAPIDTDLAALRCPPGAVLVVREASPRLTVLLPRAAAIVADLGETTAHLAVVARELRVPALFATRRATAALAPGAIVTVDADDALVYAGRVASLLEPAPAAPARADANRERLAAVAEHIVPLTLRHRLASGFSARKCRTLHDLIRYCHQATIEAMFAIGDQALRHDSRVRRLRSSCPIDCRVIDLGGGVRPEAAEEEIAIDDVSCRPMRALWGGMTDPRLGWQAIRPVSKRGFMSSVVSFGFDEDARVRDLGEPSFAFVTRDYLSLNSRIGYHFATIDARIDDEPGASYLSFRFVGGSTGVEQRSRRGTVLERLLLRHGFETDRKVDLVNARIRRLPAAAMEEKLHLVGMLMEFANHLDMALTADNVAGEYEQAFLRGDYRYGRGDHA